MLLEVLSENEGLLRGAQTFVGVLASILILSVLLVRKDGEYNNFIYTLIEYVCAPFKNRIKRELERYYSEVESLWKDSSHERGDAIELRDRIQHSDGGK